MKPQGPGLTPPPSYAPVPSASTQPACQVEHSLVHPTHPLGAPSPDPEGASSRPQPGSAGPTQRLVWGHWRICRQGHWFPGGCQETWF